MHLTLHYGSGVLLSLLLFQFIPYDVGVLIALLLGSISPDVDYIFSRKAPQHNHRMLFTHSLWCALGICVIGLVLWIFLQMPEIFFAGIAYSIHLCLDLLDWGVNIFYTAQIRGPALLFPAKHREELSHFLTQERNPKWFFLHRYYRNRGIIAAEIGCFVLSVIGIVLCEFLPDILILGYILLIAFHSLEGVITYSRQQTRVKR